MRTIKQNFYDNFKCIADKCPCTCCSGWQIVIDEATLDKYDTLDGPLADRLNSSVDWMEGTFMQKNNKDCAFLNKSGLCDLISEAGEDILCDTCRLYPRHVEEYEDLREWSLSLSCPEAARMLTSLKEYMDFNITDDDEDDPLESEFEDFDFILFSKLQDARDLIFEIIKKNNIADSVAIILELTKRLQESYDSGDYFTMDDCLEEFSDDDIVSKIPRLNLADYIRNNTDILYELERLSDDWDDYLTFIDSLPASYDADNASFIESGSQDDHSLILKNILISLLYTYFLGSIYTGMIYGVTGMCLFAGLTVDGILAGKSAALGRSITLKEYEEVLYRYSRETEHSDLNINALLEYFDL